MMISSDLKTGFAEIELPDRRATNRHKTQTETGLAHQAPKSRVIQVILRQMTLPNFLSRAMSPSTAEARTRATSPARRAHPKTPKKPTGAILFLWLSHPAPANPRVGSKELFLPL
jgi:hypothetical protein